MAYTPRVFTKGGKTVLSEDVEHERQLEWEGWSGGPAVELPRNVIVAHLADVDQARTDLEAKIAAVPLSSAGKSAYQVAVDNGFVGSEAAWLASLQGGSGAAGRSAYQLAVDGGFVGTQADWLASLKGPKGDPGTGGTTTAKWTAEVDAFKTSILNVTLVEGDSTAVVDSTKPSVLIITG